MPAGQVQGLDALALPTADDMTVNLRGDSDVRVPGDPRDDRERRAPQAEAAMGPAPAAGRTNEQLTTPAPVARPRTGARRSGPKTYKTPALTAELLPRALAAQLSHEPTYCTA
jgi:hypothetical protein